MKRVICWIAQPTSTTRYRQQRWLLYRQHKTPASYTTGPTTCASQQLHHTSHVQIPLKQLQADTTTHKRITDALSHSPSRSREVRAYHNNVRDDGRDREREARRLRERERTDRPPAAEGEHYENPAVNFPSDEWNDFLPDCNLPRRRDNQ